MYYLSERGLAEIDDGSTTVTTSWETGVQRLFSLKRSHAEARTPSSAERVEQALRRARRLRPVHRHLLDPVCAGQLIDVTIAHLDVGVMPFAYLGEHVDGPYGEWVKTFWGHGFADRYEVMLLGSLDNVRGSVWADPTKEALMKIGHNYPSDPSTLSELVASELQLQGADVAGHVSSVQRWEPVEPGQAAVFAREQTSRAECHKVAIDGHTMDWRRQRPIARAKVVGVVADVDRSEQALLVRPVLVVDRS